MTKTAILYVRQDNKHKSTEPVSNEFGADSIGAYLLILRLMPEIMMSHYSVKVETLAQDISDEVRNEILEFLRNYDFPYVRTVSDKTRLRSAFIDCFTNRRTVDWLKHELEQIPSSTRQAAVAIALTESNRLHTWGVGQVLKKKGQTKCTTVHGNGTGKERGCACQTNLEGKDLSIDEILANSFPADVRELKRTDIPMVPQHVNCRHVLAPLEPSSSSSEHRVFVGSAPS
jgi:hypothetical protein